MSILQYLREGLQSIPAYHGSNNKHIDKFVVPSGNGKEAMLWFTNDRSYANQNGSNIYTVKLPPTNILTYDSFDGMGGDDIEDAIRSANPTHNITSDMMTNAWKMLQPRFKKFENGELPVEQIFAGMGGMKVIKELGFDMQVIDSPYDKTGDTKFYLVFNDNIIHKEDNE
jgi:hypothetical protein